MFFKKVQHKLTTLLCITLMSVFVVAPTVAFAQLSAAGGGTNVFSATSVENSAKNQTDVAAAAKSVFWDVTSITQRVVTSLLNFSAVITLQIGSFLLFIAGKLLDYSINLTVIDLAKNLDGMDGITTAWTLLRDLMNMSFIFILLYHAILTMLGKGDAKRIIIGIVSAAILINFSMFFTKVIIDWSNVVTIGFYRSIESVGERPDKIGTGTTFSFSGAFMNSLGLGGVYDPNLIAQIWKAGVTSSDASMKMTIALGGTLLFMLVASFAFLAMTVLFVIRFIAFILLLIVSPVAYVAQAIPGTGKYKDKYWETLLGQALFAPIFMIICWVVLTVTGSEGFLKEAGSANILAALISPDMSAMSVIMRYLVMIGLMIQAVITSKNFATQGASFTKTAISTGMTWTGGALFGGTAMLGRNTFGRIGSNWANDEELKDKASKGDLRARLQLQAGNRLQNATFDVRNTKTYEKTNRLSEVGSFGKATTKTFKGVFDSTIKSKIEEKEKVASLMRSSDKQIAEAKEALKNEDRKKEWEKQRDEFFASDAWKNSDDMKKINQKIADAETLLTPYKTQKIEAEQKLDRQKATLKKQKDALNKLRNTTRDGLTDLQIAKLDGDIRLAETNEIRMRQDVENAQNEFDVVNGQYKEYKKEYDKWKNAEKAAKDAWLADDQRKLIEVTGGQKEEKDAFGNVKKALVEGREAAYLDAQAENFSKQNKWKEVWFDYNLNNPLNPGNLVNNALGLGKEKRSEVARKLRKAGKRNKE